MKTLIVGAGITGAYTAARLTELGGGPTLLARGAKAERLRTEGLHLRDGLTGKQKTVRLPITEAPIREQFDLIMVCVQELHRPAILPIIEEAPGRPIVWYLGNTTTGYEDAASHVGRDRVLGGFPGVGGTWEGDVLVYGDRKKPEDKPFDNLIIGEAYEEAAPAAQTVISRIETLGMQVTRYVPIMAWHLCHVAFILPLAAVVYRHNGNLDAAAKDGKLLRQCIRVAKQSFAAVEQAGYPVLPVRFKRFKLVPTVLEARVVAKVLRSPFGKIGLGGHANTARAEMVRLAEGFQSVVGGHLHREARTFLDSLSQ